jgi:hypothetical protein
LVRKGLMNIRLNKKALSVCGLTINKGILLYIQVYCISKTWQISYSSKSTKSDKNCAFSFPGAIPDWKKGDYNVSNALFFLMELKISKDTGWSDLG